MSKRKRITIRAGSCTEVIEYIPTNSHDAPRQRAAKSRASSEARKRKNAAMSRRNLKMRLAANFTPGRDYFCTLTFEAGTEPRNRPACEAAAGRFIRRLRDVRRRRGQALKWIYVVEHRHGEGLWHIHIVINAAAGWRADLEELESLWEIGTVQLSQLFTGRHRKTAWADLARYLGKERPEDDPERGKVGTHTYHCSRGLTGPAVASEWVQGSELPPLPAAAVCIEREERQTEYSVFIYLSYELPHLTE